MNSTRRKVLAHFLKEDVKDIISNGNNRYSFKNTEYLVATQVESNLEVKNYMIDNLWLQNDSFIYRHASNLDCVDIYNLKKALGKNSNRIFLKLVNFDALVKEALMNDNAYYLSVDKLGFVAGNYFIYRTN